MVRPGGRDHGRAPERPPPPDYMAAIMQQFELNHQFMTGIMGQFPHLNNQNQNPPSITLPEFMRLNPTQFRNSKKPLDADDWIRDITHEMEFANVSLPTFSPSRPFSSRGPLLNGGTHTSVPCLLE